MTYEELLKEAAAQYDVEVYEERMKPAIKGLYSDGIVWINKGIPTHVEKACVLAEEIGHHNTSTGDILDKHDIPSRKQEKRARGWAYEQLVPLTKLLQAYEACVKGRHEIADYLDVTESFLEEAIRHYQEKYGLAALVDNRYMIYFDPLGVAELFE